MKALSLDDVLAASKRISGHIIKTPVISSDILNERLGCEIFFKLENQQKTGAFKIRGALNHLLNLKEQNKLPKKVVAVSSGNHAQAVAYACKLLGVEALIYTSKITSSIKIQATRSYGAQLVVTEKRKEANQLALDKVKEGYHFIHPYDDGLVIAGQGTACLESIDEIGKEIDAIFTPCGGGGLPSGTYLASQILKNKPLNFACEPQNANDAAISLKTGEIYQFEESPYSIADGARTLSISQRTFQYLKQIDGIIETSEEEIIYWTQWLHYLLKNTIEPTSAMAMAACAAWIKQNNISGKRALVILSGGNISTATYQKIWEKDYLEVERN
ncbi:MAG: serine/threonine dehydratase [Proteobacteria bacterium]|nr:serine/threonine dehydratase [Pseudomonadota bacterium]